MTPLRPVVCETTPRFTILRRTLLLATAAAIGFAVARHGESARPRGCLWAETEHDLAKLVELQYVAEGFPQWAAEHPKAGCPRSLRELDPYMVTPIQLDPWGREYNFTCGGGKLYLVSYGPDRTANTADDIWSHE
jgi:hypothetical protein